MYQETVKKKIIYLTILTLKRVSIFLFTTIRVEITLLMITLLKIETI